MQETTITVVVLNFRAAPAAAQTPSGGHVSHEGTAGAKGNIVEIGSGITIEAGSPYRLVSRASEDIEKPPRIGDAGPDGWSN